MQHCIWPWIAIGSAILNLFFILVVLPNKSEEIQELKNENYQLKKTLEQFD